jgi:hypothetical protein
MFLLLQVAFIYSFGGEQGIKFLKPTAIIFKFQIHESTLLHSQCL